MEQNCGIDGIYVKSAKQVEGDQCIIVPKLTSPCGSMDWTEKSFGLLSFQKFHLQIAILQGLEHGE